ncbi:Uma2 family endonuclease [Calothrix sp. PCC 6303]|uniref:Uma2 family endonuclease n=1 Tax=Calothrix sp. PCC 6303 TaxID=1170562 RepID=UPI0002D9FF2E|nr:Uma2 family endonuclease [Calothrix sp. PCC 6303]
MITNHHQNHLSPQEYLEGEKISQIKHEYIDGEVYAMAGASDAHVTITGNLYMLLRNHHRGSGCRVYMADMKAQVEELNRYFYPDVMVTCDTRDQASDYFKSHPCLIIEVLSDTTEGFDRGKKFQDYTYLPSLQEYVLVSQDRMNVECFRRNEKGRWELYRFGVGEIVEFSSVDFRCDIAAIYEDLTSSPA